MARKPNTTKDGNAWTQQTINAVWQKGNPIAGYSADVYRLDKCNKVMQFDKHGNRGNDFGWEIDHIDPVANGGGDELNNLQPLNWKNNLDKGDSTNWKCPN